MKTERLTREFRYLGMLLADPDPAMTPEQVRDCYCHVYPEITTAVIEGPEPVENKLVFRFTRAIGSKG